MSTYLRNQCLSHSRILLHPMLVPSIQLNYDDSADNDSTDNIFNDLIDTERKGEGDIFDFSKDDDDDDLFDDLLSENSENEGSPPITAPGSLGLEQASRNTNNPLLKDPNPPPTKMDINTFLTKQVQEKSENTKAEKGTSPSKVRI